MSLVNRSDIRNVLGTAMAGVLAFSLAACDQSPPPANPAGQTTSGAVSLPQPVMQAEPKVEPAQKAIEPPKPSEDALLAARVKAALAGEPGLKMLAIDVGSVDGVITLYGTADTRAQRDRAERSAKKVEGVVSVKNQLVIVKGS